MKKCKTCGQEKPISEYYKKGISKKGIQLYQSNCKKCSREIYKNWAIVNHDRFNKTRRKWAKRNRAKLAAMKARHRKKHPDKTKARNAITMKLAKNRLTPKPCATCGVRPTAAYPTEAHHPDYSKPFEVVWLCRKHHLEEHGKVQRIKIMNLQLEVIQH